MNTRKIRKQLKAAVAAMPKCPVCGGFAIPSTTPGPEGQQAMVCGTHRRFLVRAA